MKIFWAGKLPRGRWGKAKTNSEPVEAVSLALYGMGRAGRSVWRAWGDNWRITPRGTLERFFWPEISCSASLTSQKTSSHVIDTGSTFHSFLLEMS